MLGADIVLSVPLRFGQRIFNDMLGARGQVVGRDIRRGAFAGLFDNRILNAFCRCAAFRKIVRRNACVLAHQSQEQMLGADIGVSQFRRDLHRDLQDLLCFSGKTVCHIGSILS